MCILSSCREDFDFDEARAQTQYEKFSNVFIKSFGKPQEGHQWGFDKANLAMDGAMSTRAVIKQDMPEYYQHKDLYGEHPADIKDIEHDEVYAWFSNHRVTWAQNPVSYNGTNTTRVAVGNVAEVIYSDENSDAWKAYGSLRDYASVNPLGEYTIGTTPNFNHGWVQHVAHNEEEEVVYCATPGPSGKMIYKAHSDNYFRFEGNYVKANEDGSDVETTENVVYFADAENGNNLQSGSVLTINKTEVVFDNDINSNVYKYAGLTGVAEQQAWVYFDLPTALKENVTYVLTFKVKGSQSGKQDQLAWRFRQNNQDKGVFDKFSDSETWTEVKTFAKCSGNDVKRLLIFIGFYTGTLYFDDIKLVEGVNDSNLVFYKVTEDDVVLYKDKNTQEVYKEGIGNYVEVSKQTGLDISKGKIESRENIGICVYKTPQNPVLMKKGNQMDYFSCWDLNSGNYEGNHLNEFNATGAWGWARQPSTPDPKNTGSDLYNALLVTNADIDNWTFKSSIDGGNIHDKYLLVYLRGDGYEGWYLGFDYESSGNPNENRNFADGICNDFIIKLTAAANVAYKDIRIMVEDLGGDVSLNKSDIDYNDIVLDVSTKTENIRTTWYPWTASITVIELTLQAAGGTLPLIVEYDGTDLFETHAFFENEMVFTSDKYDKSQVDYSIMYRTGDDSDRSGTNAKTYKLYVNSNVPSGQKFATQIYGDFDLSKLHFKVYRFSADKYVESKGNPDPIEWVTLVNQKNGTPVMFCVPQKDANGNSVQWMRERKSIDIGYPDFQKWVGNSSLEFWNNKGSELY